MTQILIHQLVLVRSWPLAGSRSMSIEYEYEYARLHTTCPSTSRLGWWASTLPSTVYSCSSMHWPSVLLRRLHAWALLGRCPFDVTSAGSAEAGPRMDKMLCSGPRRLQDQE